MANGTINDFVANDCDYAGDDLLINFWFQIDLAAGQFVDLSTNCVDLIVRQRHCSDQSGADNSATIIVKGFILVGDFNHEVGSVLGDKEMNQAVEIFVYLALKHFVDDRMFVGIEQLRCCEKLNQRIVGLENIGQTLEINLNRIGRFVLFGIFEQSVRIAPSNDLLVQNALPLLYFLNVFDKATDHLTVLLSIEAFAYNLLGGIDSQVNYVFLDLDARLGEILLEF